MHLGSVPWVHYKLRIDTTVKKKIPEHSGVSTEEKSGGTPLWCRERDNYRLFGREISTNYS